MDAQSIKAVTYLSKQPILHMDMLQLIARGTTQIIAVSDEGVLLFDTMSQAYFVTANSEPYSLRHIKSIQQIKQNMTSFLIQ
ncbi:hypothetical protein [Isobaculum melis]|uniref:Uncharacterized protein n=1 Tax=Isobaculum melis TaxID=142588 RepID=A0A1H9RBG4_9LACT|nr:hypothetical protein [Isobaculum melis]SER69263.1 hypothetical protein SAMN04488559_103138 [Isobaculum melis]